MKRSIHGLLCFLSMMLLFTNCRKKAFDEFYERPDNLAAPIYQQLQERQTFTSLLKVIDKSGYKETLSSAGSWTFFAPNDAAFQSFFQENGIANADEITAEMAEKIVRYSMAYDGEKSDRLSDFFSRTGFIENQGFRRRTLYYDFVYNDKNKSDQNIKAIAFNRNGPTVYQASDFNNKNIPIFLDAFMNFRSLPPTDYQAFYGAGSTYTGFNVGPASVLADGKDIVAENGVIHIIDKVLTPPPSIDQYINSNSRYSLFKSLLDRYVTFELNTDISRKYNVLSGNTDNVYVKTYNGSIAFAPNNENYLKIDANDAQQDSYSIVAPNDDAVKKYAKETLLYYYPAGTTLNELAVTRGDIIQAFVNAHMLTSTLWPSKFNTTPTFLNENLILNQQNDVVERKALSNGFFYGVKEAQNANVFRTVYGTVFLDPKFSIMKAALDRYAFSPKLQTPSFNYMLLPVSDEVLRQMGFSYEPTAFPNAPIRLDGGADEVILKRIVGSHVIDLNNHGEVPDIFNGEGFLLTATNEPDNQEYIRYKNGRFFSSGTIDSAYSPMNGLIPGTHLPSIGADSISSRTIVNNRKVIYPTGALVPTENNVGLSIERHAQVETDPYYRFFQYLKNSNNSLWPLTVAGNLNNVNRIIGGVELGLSYTIFIPENSQILKAIADGKLPSNPATTDETERNKIERFIKYHILNKSTIVADGNPNKRGKRETLLKNELGDPLLLTISENSPGSLKILDAISTVPATVINPKNSLLSNRTVIHLIDKYLSY